MHMFNSKSIETLLGLIKLFSHTSKGHTGSALANLQPKHIPLPFRAVSLSPPPIGVCVARRHKAELQRLLCSLVVALFPNALQLFLL